MELYTLTLLSILVCGKLRGKTKQKLWSVLFFCVAWTIWLERNKIKFEEKQLDWCWMWELIKIKLGLWMNAFYSEFNHTPMTIANNLEVVLY